MEYAARKTPKPTRKVHAVGEMIVILPRARERDRITTEVVGSLAVKITQVELQRARAKPAGSLEAYDYVLRARQAMSEAKRTANVDARALLRKAIELDPHYADAYSVPQLQKPADRERVHEGLRKAGL